MDPSELVLGQVYSLSLDEGGYMNFIYDGYESPTETYKFSNGNKIVRICGDCVKQDVQAIAA